MDLLQPFTFEQSSPKTKTGKICLFDADYLKYISTYMVKKNLDDPEGIRDFNGDTPVIYFLKSFLYANVFDKIEDKIIFCFSGGSNKIFRNNIAFERKYKGKRIKEESYEGEFDDHVSVFSYMIKNHVCLYFEDLEADDIISSLHDENTFIWSKDKDLKQLPGLHYDISSNSIYSISEKDAGFNLCCQLIQGDSVDNITGIPNFGEKKAAAFLLQYQPKEWIIRVMELYMIQMGKLTGADAFSENWMLIKLRPNRGSYFREKYSKMFSLKNELLK